MKMIAIGTVHGRELIRSADPKNPKSRAKYKDLIAKPGEEFDTEAFGIDEKEAQVLIDGKAAKRKTKEVADDGSPRVVQKPDLNQMNDADLAELAKDRGVAIKDGASRADVIAALSKSGS